MKVLIVAALWLLLAGVISADVDGHQGSVDEILGEIRRDLGLSSNEGLDPNSVDPGSLEALGDVLMSAAHPEAEQHDFMDEMMGGEGSQSLAAAHRWMAYRYLSGAYGPDFSGSAMMGGLGFGPWRMMGNLDIPCANVPYESPEDILKRRYARGEISREDYLLMLEDIVSPE